MVAQEVAEQLMHAGRLVNREEQKYRGEAHPVAPVTIDGISFDTGDDGKQAGIEQQRRRGIKAGYVLFLVEIEQPY
jgi:hypothetical protein